MAELNISEYQISLWDIKLITETIDGQSVNSIQEQKICDLGNSNYFRPCDAINPKLTLKNNGEITFEFDIYTNYWDAEEGKQIENPYMNFLNAERRIKLYYHDQWYDFIITSLSHTNKNKTLSVKCNNAFAVELGKSGYSIEFSTDLENNLNSAFNLAAAVVENSDWQILDNNGKIVGTDTIPEGINAKSDILKEIQNEYLYIATVLHPITCKQYFSDEQKTIESGNIYIFASCLNNGTKPFTFLLFTEEEISKYSQSNELILNTDVWRIVSDYEMSDEPNNSGWYIPYMDLDGTKVPIIDETSIVLQTSLRARRFISSKITQYDSLIDQYVNLYTFTGETGESGYPSDWTKNCEIKGYEKVEYLTTDSNRNLIANASNFLSASGWENKFTTTQERVKNDDAVIKALRDSNDVAMATLNLKFGSTQGVYYNSGFKSSQSYLGDDGLTLGEKFVLKIKLYNSNGAIITPVSGSRFPLGCQLWEYTSSSSGEYQLLNNPILDLYDREGHVLTWNVGYEYSILATPSTYTGDIYTYSESTGLYAKIASDTTSFDPAKNYYYRSDIFYYAVAPIEHGSYSIERLFDGDNNFGFFIKTTQANTEFYIKDFEVFKYITKGDDTTPYLPEDAKAVQSITTYYYYKDNSSYSTKDEIEYIKRDAPDSKLDQKYNTDCAKMRSITESKSNRYNLLSTICDTFECWMKFHIARDDQGKILLENRTLYEELTAAEKETINTSTNNDTTPESQRIALNYYVYNDGGYSVFNANAKHYFLLTTDEKTIINGKGTGTYYYYNSSSSQYEPFVVTPTNLLWEDTNFYDYCYGLDLHNSVFRKKIVKVQRKYITFHSSIGESKYTGFIYGLNATEITRKVESENIVTKLLVEENHNKYAEYGYCSISDAQSNSSGETYIYNFNHYINRKLLKAKQLIYDLNSLNQDLGKYNKQINTLTEKFSQASTQVDSLSAQATVYGSAYNETVSEFDSQNKQLEGLSLYTYGYWNSTAARRSELLGSGNTAAITVFHTLERLEASQAQYKILYDNYNSQYIEWLAKKNEFSTSLKSYALAKTNRMYNFELKYSSYIREGTWTSEDYDNAEVYYLDACNTSENSAYPKVSYTLKVADLSGLEEYSNYKFDVGDRTYIQDEEMFGYYSDGITPLRKDVAITQIVYNLTKPSENSITIATFKDEFNDLFERFAAATQKLEYNEASYDQASTLINSTTGIDAEVLQQSVDNNNLVIGNSGSQGVTVDATGIKLTSVASPNNVIRLIGQGIFLSDDGGNSWISGLTANGFNTSIFKSGTIYTSKMNILDDNGSNVFGWNQYGITAYDVLNSRVNIGRFVRFDRFGIYGYSGGSEFTPSIESEITDNKSVQFSLTWSGLQIRTNHKEYNGATLVDGGGISISQTDDFTVYDALGTDRIKIGCLTEATTSSAAQYGMRLKSIDNNPMLYANDDGTFWLADIMYVGGTSQSDAQAEFGASHEHYSGWKRDTTSTELTKPLYPIPSDTGFQRILKIDERPSYGRLVACTVAVNFTASNLKSRSETTTISANSVIYILEDCLLEKYTDLLFFTTATTTTTTTEYMVNVTYSSSQIGSYYIPQISSKNIISAAGTVYTDRLYYRYGYKFEIYDDGTVRAPKFCIDEDGNVFLNYDTSTTLIAPIIKASDNSLTEMTVKSWGFRVNSMESGTASLRLEMGVTTYNETAVNPYIYFVPNRATEETTGDEETERLKKRGLVKMFENNFMWVGNAVLKDSNTFVYADNDNRGLLFSFNLLDGNNGGNPIAYIVNGDSKVEIATRNSPAVFG